MKTVILQDPTQIRGHVANPATSRANLFRLLALAALLVACYFPMLLMTGRTIVESDDMAYGFFAPLVALYLVWAKRDDLLAPKTPPSYWSLAFLVIGACLATFAALTISSTVSRFGFMVSIAGCLLLVGGWHSLRLFIFPLFLLFFTFPIPDVLYGEITQPLQLLATRLSESGLELLGFSVLREGNVLHLTFMSISVIEACSGLRSLITLFFFCLVYSYFFETRFVIRATLVILAIPSAILVNALRIASTGVLGRYNMAWTEGLYHEIVGWLAFSLGFVLVLAIHRCLLHFTRASARNSNP